MFCPLLQLTSFLSSRRLQVSFLLLNLCLMLSFGEVGKIGGKMVWIDCDSIYLSKENGWSGMRRLREFNVALLGKWCWRRGEAFGVGC